MCAAPPMAAPATTRRRSPTSTQAIAARPELQPRLCQPRAGRTAATAVNEALRRLQPRHPGRPALRRRLCRTRQHLSAAGPARPGARRLQRGDPARLDRRAGLPQSRPRSTRRRASTRPRSRISPPRSASRRNRRSPITAAASAISRWATRRTALDDFNEAVKRDRHSFHAWTNQGLALEQLGDRQKAFAAFARAASLNPNYQPAKDGMRRTTGSA